MKYPVIILTIGLIIVLNNEYTLTPSLALVGLYQQAYAHFFGVPILENKTAGDYKIVFQPYPTVPLAGDNSTRINLSILGTDDENIYGVFSSLIIKAKDTGEVLKKFPYKFHEFSDLTFPYTFPHAQLYNVILESRINGDPKYTQTPMVVDFELRVGGGYEYLTFTQQVGAYLIVAMAIVVAIIVYLRKIKGESIELN